MYPEYLSKTIYAHFKIRETNEIFLLMQKQALLLFQESGMIEFFQVLPIVSLQALGRGKVHISLSHLQLENGKH
jgi:hypothetical protein